MDQQYAGEVQGAAEQQSNEQVPHQVVTQTLEQRRAAALLTHVQGVQTGQDDAVKKEYRRMVERLPVMILTNGLGQALAYLHSRAAGPNDAERPGRRQAMQLVINHLQDLVLTVRGLYAGLNDSLLASVCHGDREQLRLATDEALAVLTWWTKFTRAFLPKPDGED